MVTRSTGTFCRDGCDVIQGIYVYQTLHGILALQLFNFPYMVDRNK